jgi:hypothetical protein
MDRLETSLIAEAQADPTVLDVYDFEAAVRMRGDFLGVPASVLRSKDDVTALRERRQKAQQQAQQQAGAMQMQQAAGEEMAKRVAAS